MYAVIQKQEAARQDAEAERARVLSGWAEIVALRIDREKQQLACVMRPIWEQAEETEHGKS